MSSSGGPLHVSVDERGARGGDERGGGRAVGVPPGAELAGRGQLLRAARAALAQAAAAVPTRAAQEGMEFLFIMLLMVEYSVYVQFHKSVLSPFNYTGENESRYTSRNVSLGFYAV